MRSSLELSQQHMGVSYAASGPPVQVPTTIAPGQMQMYAATPAMQPSTFVGGVPAPGRFVHGGAMQAPLPADVTWTTRADGSSAWYSPSQQQYFEESRTPFELGAQNNHLHHENSAQQARIEQLEFQNKILADQNEGLLALAGAGARPPQ